MKLHESFVIEEGEPFGLMLKGQVRVIRIKNGKIIGGRRDSEKEMQIPK